jgi:murein DD-endopeptidase MepM/ murein hydrolase activator NlpD
MSTISNNSSVPLHAQTTELPRFNSTPNFVLVNSGSNGSTLFGDILPFYSSYKELSSVIVATREGLARLVMYSGVFLVCITSFISEFLNNAFYAVYTVSAATYSVARTIPSTLQNIYQATRESITMASHADTREMWYLQLKVDARLAYNNARQAVRTTLAVGQKLYLSILVLLVLLIVSAPVGNSIMPFGAENSFISRALDGNRTVVKAGGAITVDQSIISTSNSFEEGEAFLAQRIIQHESTETDTYESIAELYGVDVSTILFNNRLAADDPVPATLVIPSSDGYIYQTAANTTPEDLERIYGVDKNIIYSQNEDVFDQAGGFFPPDTLLLLPTQDFAAVGRANEAEDLRKENLRLAQEQEEKRQAALAQSRRNTYANANAGVVSAGFIWPTSGNVTRCVTGYHIACDIANAGLPPIFSAQSGTVSSVYRYSVSGYGLAVVVDHGNGLQTLYAHMSEIYVSPGQSIGQGESLGRMGCTGYCTGPHLHFEIRQNGVKQNPLRYLP